MLNLRLCRLPVYAAAQATPALSGVSLLGGLVVLPLSFEVLRHQAALQTGELLLVHGIGSATAMLLGGRITTRIGGGWTAAVGLGITLIATAPTAVLPERRIAHRRRLALLRLMSSKKGSGPPPHLHVGSERMFSTFGTLFEADFTGRPVPRR